MNLRVIENLGSVFRRKLPRRLALLRVGLSGIAAGTLPAIGENKAASAAQGMQCTARFRAFEDSGVEPALEGQMRIQFDPTGATTEGTLLIDHNDLGLVAFAAGAEVTVLSQYAGLTIGMAIDVYQEELPNTFSASGTADSTLGDCLGAASGTLAITSESEGVIFGVWRLDVQGVA